MIRLILTAACVLHLGFLSGQTQLFSPPTTPISEEGRVILPARADILQLDEDAMRNSLPVNGSTSITLPLGKGETLAFAVRPHAAMEPDLQREFPEIRTFIGEALDGSGAVAHLDFTVQGFHAMILRPGAPTVFIDPLHHPFSRGTYQVYDRNDFAAGFTGERFECLLHDNGVTGDGNRDRNGNGDGDGDGDGRTIFGPRKLPATSPNLSPNQNLLPVQPASLFLPGEQLRTYRLALACTGEYAQFHGGTTASALSAMVTTMNRVNGVYERDVAIHMNIIAGNSAIIYLNGSTDPYTNNSGSTMLNENQSTCDAVIGTANYDIGHVFSTGGGGIAQLNSPCSSSGKARGVTGGGSPVGDPFDIDYVAHEMGHQFGANHTQNNSCNRASSAAYEPGSASTIMGYAGICAPNLQSNSDDHFHIHSINEMINFSVNGNGNTCAVTTSTGNSVPTVEAGMNGLTIPKGTPFELTASGFDANGDALTYNWEEYDLGPATASGDNNLTNPSGTQPVFRSWPSTESPTRVFPRPVDLVNGTTTIGEHIPTYGRAMNFKCTVRDNVAGGGAHNQDLVSFNIDGGSGPFEVLAPNGGTAVGPGVPTVVSWDVAGTDSPPVNCTAVDIWLSTDGGYTFDIPLATGVENDGAESVIFPAITTSSARIKVKASGSIFFDISDGNFMIDPTLNPVEIDLGVGNLQGIPSGGCGSNLAPTVTVTNYGLTTATAFEVIFITAESGTLLPDTNVVNWTGNLPLGATTTVAACDANCYTPMALGNGTVEVVLVPPAGDEDASNQNLSAPFEIGEGSPVTLTLSTDCWGSEVGWTLSDASGALIDEVAAGSLSSSTTFEQEFCLADGCYEFAITDAYGDGMFGSQWNECGIDGDYAMTGPDGAVLFAMGDPDYGTGTSHSFCLETVIPCTSDLDGSGAVDVGDLLLVLADFGCQSSCSADLDGDGIVGVTDVLALLGEFGQTCP